MEEGIYLRERGDWGQIRTMHIQFFGAAGTVTGSCHLVDNGRSRILLDCGLFQGKRKESFKKNREFPFDPKTIDAVVLSHAHIDHSGNLPQLVKEGFRGRIICTRATASLCHHMLLDSAHIQEKDVFYVNKRRKRQKQTLFEPLYTTPDAEKCLSQFHGVDYETWEDVTDGIRVRFEDSGHILGSASCHLDIDDHGRTKRLVFSGDVGRYDRVILKNPVPPKEADVFICESTYGNRLHGPVVDVQREIKEVVKLAQENEGKLLMPAFSVGRTQLLVYHLNQLVTNGEVDDIAVFVDSPLSANVTQVFRRHPECYDEEATEMLKNQNDPFGFDKLTYIREVEASKAIATIRHPYVLISSSGMCEAGRVLHHLKHVAPHPNNIILATGFMAPHTLGRRIVEKNETIRIFGEEFPLRAQVRTVSGLSAHADQAELMEYASHMKTKPAKTFLVHGEEDQQKPFADKLHENGFPDVRIPVEGQKFEV